MKRYYHWCCKGLRHDLIFSSIPEFIAGMNRIAVCLLHCRTSGKDITIIAFCLLNNHFHFVLYGTENSTASFMDYYRMLTCKWIAAHRGEKLHERISLGHWEAITSEKVKEKIAYTLRQSYEAGHPISPQGYRWSSARFMFSDNTPLLCSAVDIGTMSNRAIQKIVFSEVSIPASWPLLSEGIIWPGAYVDIAGCEKLFSNVKEFMFYLNNRNIDISVNTEMMTLAPTIPDNEVKDQANFLARDMFDKKNVSSCNAEERLAIARYLRKHLHCGNRQLARIVRMMEGDIQKLA